MRALIVDDSRAIRSVVARMLRDMGFAVAEAANGCDALSQLQSLPDVPDIALLDWNMPVMDGYSLLCSIRKDSRYAAMLVMMVTTETEVERMQMAMTAGANEYLMKPFTPDALRQKIDLLGLPRNV